MTCGDLPLRDRDKNDCSIPESLSETSLEFRPPLILERHDHSFQAFYAHSRPDSALPASTQRALLWTGLQGADRPAPRVSEPAVSRLIGFDRCAPQPW